MSIPTIKVSTVPAARTFLYNATVAAVADQAFIDPTVRVFLGEDNAPEDYSDIVIIGKHVTRQTDTHRMVGSGATHWLKEAYEISVHIECADMHSPDFVNVDARGYALLSIVENVVRADPSLGQLVIMAKPGHAQIESSYDQSHGGAIFLVDTTINVLAEI